jgi:photosystem II stability/assembly factor-like uncharacterized protein
LYKSTDAGATWTKMTPSDVIVNDVYVDPNDPKHVLLATDRGGVLRSEDSGNSFEASNTGFTQRQVVAYAADTHNSTQVYIGVVNDKQTGGVFASSDGGVRWQQMSIGLAGRDVFSLTMTPSDTLLAGTSHGIFHLENGAWMSDAYTAAPGSASKTTVTKKRPTTAARKGARAHAAPIRKPEGVASPQLSEALVYALTSGSAGVYAGTSAGVWRSTDSGQSWSQLQVPKLTEARYIALHGQMVLAASLTGLALSQNGGTSWSNVMPPPTLTQIGALAVDGGGNMWIGGPEGVFYSTDHGVSWKTLHNLFVRQVDGLFYDATNNRVLVSSTSGTVGFAASLPSYNISYWDTGWPLRFLRPVGDHLIGATLYDGVVVQPKMVASPFESTATAVAETATRAR